MTSRPLDELRNDLEMFDLLPSSIKQLISEADTITKDIVPATFHALYVKQMPEEEVIRVLRAHLTYVSSTSINFGEKSAAIS